MGQRAGNPAYQKPSDKAIDYLTRLGYVGVPRSDTVPGAIGPKMLKLAAERTAGTHPSLTTPEHTRQAREIMGPGALLAPEQKVILDTDPERARSVGRSFIEAPRPYLRMPHNVSNLNRLGWTEDGLAAGGSDRLVDALMPHGDTATLAAAVTAHLDAGADHLAIQALGPGPVATYRALAPLLAG